MSKTSNQGHKDSRAAELVSEYVEEFPQEFSDSMENKARALAARSEWEHPVNRTPSAIAAGAIYMAGLLCNEKVPQSEVKEATGVATVTTSETYRLIWHYEGYRHEMDLQHLGVVSEDTSEELADE